MRILFLQQQPCVRALKYSVALRGALPRIALGFAYQGKTLSGWYGSGDELFERWWNLGKTRPRLFRPPSTSFDLTSSTVTTFGLPDCDRPRALPGAFPSSTTSTISRACVGRPTRTASQSRARPSLSSSSRSSIARRWSRSRRSSSTRFAAAIDRPRRRSPSRTTPSGVTCRLCSRPPGAGTATGRGSSTRGRSR